MSHETFDRIIKDLQAFPKLQEIHFGGFGEPLMHPRIVEMVEQVKSLGVKATLTTNGTLLDEEKTIALVNARLDKLFVSIDSVQAELFREIRPGAELDAVVENLKRVQALRSQRRSLVPTIALEFVVTKQNWKEVEELPALGRALGASWVLVTHLLPHTQALADQIMYGGEIIELPKPAGWPVPVSDFLQWGILSAPRSKWGAARRCRFVEGKGFVIKWDGDVSPCYALMHSYPYFIFGRRKYVTRYVVGNVNRTSLTDVWTNEEFVLFRAKVSCFRFPSCVDCGLDCDYAQQNEDCWGNVPSCADCLWAQGIVQCP